MKPLTWLIGEWKGTGNGGFPTMDPFDYDNHIRVSFLEEAFNQDPLIHFEEIVWIKENGVRKFKHWETGFFKPTEDNRIQFYVSHNTGRIEVTYGHWIKIDSNKRSFELALESDFIRNDKDLKVTHRSYRKFILENEKMSYALQMSTEDIYNRSHHLSAEMKRA